jgi:transcriptional regulator with XRE-family HTH domain
MARPTKNKEAERRWLEGSMEQAGVGPARLAKELNLDANWVSQWKNGTRPMPDIAMLKIAKFFGISPYEIRPSLMEFESFFQDTTILDGLSDSSRSVVLNTIKHLKETEKAAGKIPFTPTSGDRRPAASRRRTR